MRMECLYPGENDTVRSTATGFITLLSEHDLLVLECSLFMESSPYNIISPLEFLQGERERAPLAPIIGLTKDTAASSGHRLGEFIMALDGYFEIDFLQSAKFNAYAWNSVIVHAMRKRKTELSVSRKFGKRDVFICHAGEDKLSVVEPLLLALENARISCWYDKNEIAWGDRIVEKISDGLKNARYVLVVLSKHSVQKTWPKTELASAIQSELADGQKRILPLIVGDEKSKLVILNEVPLIRDKRYLVWNGNGDQVAKELSILLRS